MMSFGTTVVVKKKKDLDCWVRLFEVTDPRRHPKGHTVYKVTSTVFPKNAPEAATQISVWRRFSDFKRIYKTLCALHTNLHLSGTFPPFPKDRLFGRFEPQVIEERRQSALKLLEFVALHAPLFTSQAFVRFFESGKNSDSVRSSDGALISKHDDDVSLHPMKVSVAGDGRTMLDGVWVTKRTKDDLSSEETSDENDCSEGDKIGPTKTAQESSGGALMLLSLFDPLRPAQMDLTDLGKGSPRMWEDSVCESCDNGASNFPKAFADFEEDVDQSAVDRQADDCDLVNASNGDAHAAVKSLQSAVVSPTRNGFFDDLLGTQSLDDDTESSYEDYVIDSAQLLRRAQESEARGDFEAAFTSYKRAIGILLAGVREDLDGDRREAVQRKTAKYLRRAEDIYAKHLTSPQRRDLREAMGSALRSPASELGRYKVLGVIDRVLLVFDSTDSVVCVLKVVSKSPSGDDDRAICRLPIASHVVRLLRYHETKDAVFLVLEYAAGGRLWSHLGSRIRNCGGHAGCDACGAVEPFESRECNVYAGKNFLAAKDELDGEDGTTDDWVRMDTDLLVTNARTLLKDVDATLDDSNAIHICRRLSGEDGGLCEEKEAEDQQQHHRQRFRTRRPSSTDRRRKRSSSCGGGGGSLDLQQSGTRVRHFSSVLHETNGAEDRNGCGSRIPDACVRVWATEIAAAVMTLHSYGVVCRNLNPSNVLLDQRGHILLTYFASLPGVSDAPLDARAKEAPYIAPEMFGIDCSANPACADWFSFGGILFAMLTGRTLSSCHPSGFGGHTTLNVPGQLSVEAESILRELLRANPRERLGGGVDGDAAIRDHPFFADVDWRELLDQSRSTRNRAAPTSTNEVT